MRRFNEVFTNGLPTFKVTQLNVWSAAVQIGTLVLNIFHTNSHPQFLGLVLLSVQN
jgi:hypothetical protein